MKKVLILTCNTGQGHNSSAAAILEELTRRGIPCDVADTLSFLTKHASRVVDVCFTGIYRHVPQMFDKGYTHADAHVGALSAADAVVTALLPGTKRLHRYIQEHGYTHVLCVHIFPAIMVTMIRQRYGLDVHTSFLSTDYTFYPFMEKTAVDLYYLPHEHLTEEFARCGVPREKMVATGIPIRSAFLNEPRDKAAARAALGLAAEDDVVFVMGGSMGCGPIEELVTALAERGDDRLRLLVSCGTNQKLLHTLQKVDSPRLIPFQFAENVPQIMAASDLFVSKPGGISITEAGYMGLPMVLVNMVGGCETPNYAFFTENHFAYGAADVPAAVETCLELLANPAALRAQSDGLCRHFSRNSAALICDCLRDN